MAEKIALSLDIETGDSLKTLGQLENRATELNEELRKVELGSSAFKTLKQELVGVNKQIKNTELSMEALDNEQVASELGSVAGAVGDMTSAFVLLGGTGGALEETAQNIEKAIGVSMAFKGAIEGISSGRKLLNNIIKQSNIGLKLNNKLNIAATAVAKALGVSTDTTTKSFKSLKIAMAATGIGLLIVAIGALVANWDKLKIALGGATKAQQLSNEVSKKAIETAGEELNAIDTLRRTINDETISRKDKNAAVAQLQEKYPDLLGNIRAEYLSLNDLNKALELASKLTFLKAEADAIAELRAEEFKKKLELQVDKLNDNNVGLMDYAAAFTGFATAQQSANMNTAVSIKQSDKQLAILDKLDKAKKEQIKDIQKEAEFGTIVNKVRAATNEEIVKNTVETAKNKEAQIDWREGIDMTIEKVGALGMKLNDINREVIDMDVEATQASIKAYDDYFDKRKKQREDDTLTQKEKIDNDIELVLGGLQAVKDLNSAFAKDNEAAQKRAFKVNKALSIAMTTIETYQAAQSAFASQIIPGDPTSVIRAIIASAIAVASGLARVAIISKQKFQGGGATGAAAGGGGFSGNLGGGGGNAPTLEPVTNTSTILPTGEETKVFVTETDISGVQNKVNVIEAQATI